MLCLHLYRFVCHVSCAAEIDRKQVLGGLDSQLEAGMFIWVDELGDRGKGARRVGMVCCVTGTD